MSEQYTYKVLVQVVQAGTVTVKAAGSRSAAAKARALLTASPQPWLHIESEGAPRVDTMPRGLRVD